MPFIVNPRKFITILSFLLQSLGGKASFSRIAALLYLTDIKHLLKYGAPVSGDSYLAMNMGSVPFTLLVLYKQLKGEMNWEFINTSLTGHFSVLPNGDITNTGKYDENYLSSSEVECLFETIHEHKAYSNEALQTKTKDAAWKGHNIHGELSLERMAESSGANKEMVYYIMQSSENEMKAFL